MGVSEAGSHFASITDCFTTFLLKAFSSFVTSVTSLIVIPAVSYFPSKLCFSLLRFPDSNLFDQRCLSELDTSWPLPVLGNVDLYPDPKCHVSWGIFVPDTSR